MVIKTVDKVKLLGVIINSKLKLDEHVKSLCLKANRNVSALSRVAKIVDQPKCRLLYNSFVMSNFRYSALIWMFCGKTANNEINRVHKRALRIVLRAMMHLLMSCLLKMKRKPLMFGTCRCS